jgi:hypothetical protein
MPIAVFTRSSGYSYILNRFNSFTPRYHDSWRPVSILTFRPRLGLTSNTCRPLSPTKISHSFIPVRVSRSTDLFLINSMTKCRDMQYY